MSDNVHIVIVEPDSSKSITLQKDGEYVCVWCDCTVGQRCPQGKIGAATRCRVWLKRSHLTDEAIEHEKRMNRFSR